MGSESFNPTQMQMNPINHTVLYTQKLNKLKI